MTGLHNERVRQLLGVGLDLAGHLLAAQNEEAAIHAVMRVGVELLGAQGAAFLPFNEWRATLPTLRFGETETILDEEWIARTAAPEMRHACRICDKEQGGAECMWFHEGSRHSNVYCQRLRCDGREIGVISYFSSKPFQPDEDLHHFLAETVRLADLTLSTLHAHTGEMEAIRRTVAPQVYREFVAHRDPGSEEFL